MHFPCHRTDCPGFEVELPEPAQMTADDFGTLVEAQHAHEDKHREADRPEVTHIRRQINPRRVKGDGFYKVKLGPAENGSQTLCGAEATTEDMSWGDTRHAKNLAFVSCEACKQLRSQA